MSEKPSKGKIIGGLRIPSYWNTFQQTIYEEVLEWDKTHLGGGLLLKPGSGKSLLSLVINLHYTAKEGSCGLFIASATLINNIIEQIQEHFGDTYPYEVLHPSEIRDMTKWRPQPETRLVIVTYNLLAREYDARALRRFLVHQRLAGGLFENYYDPPTDPLVNTTRGLGLIFSRRWDVVFVDEVQDCCNVNAKNCQAVCSIVAKRRWMLSGTPLKNAKPEMILGYLLMIRHDTDSFGGTVRGLKNLIRDGNLSALKSLGVYREFNEAEEEVDIEKIIVTHPMHTNEALIYKMFKTVVSNINTEIKHLKEERMEQGVDTGEIRKLASSLMATITYLRQSLVLPLLPLSTIAVNMSEPGRDSLGDTDLRVDLSRMIDKEIERLEIGDWLDNEEAALSSRIAKVLDTLEGHQEKVVIFSSYRTSLDMLEHYVTKAGRKYFTLSDKMNPTKRRLTIKLFKKSKRGVLGLTYGLGAQGLNLQFASVAYILDFDWSSTDTFQAISRLARMGQETTVRVYYFVCGAGIEKAVLEKQLDKSGVLKKLMDGTAKRLMKKMSFSKFINDLTSLDDNIELVDRLYVSPHKYKDLEDTSDEKSEEIED